MVGATSGASANTAVSEENICAAVLPAKLSRTTARASTGPTQPAKPIIVRAAISMKMLTLKAQAAAAAM